MRSFFDKSRALSLTASVAAKSANVGTRTISPTNAADVKLMHVLGLDGVKMSPQVAEGLPAAHYCVDKIASFIASMPRGVYRKTEQGREKYTDHDQNYLISTRPNGWTTQQEFDKSMIYTLLFWGNAYAYMELNQMGRPIGYYYWHPYDVTISMESDGLWYKNHDTGQTVHYSQIIHLKDGPVSSTTYKAKSRIERCADTFREAKQYQKFSQAFIENGTHAGFAFIYPVGASQQQVADLKKQLQQQHAGISNAGSNIVLGGAPTVQRIGIPLRDAQFIENREMHAQEIGLIFGFKPGQVGGKTGESFNSLEQYGIEFIQYPCIPIAKQIEQEYDAKAFRDSERGKVYNKIDFKGILRGSVKDRIELYKAMGPALTPNDMLTLEDMNTFEGGDVRMAPLNYTTLDHVVDGTNLKKPDNNITSLQNQEEE